METYVYYKNKRTQQTTADRAFAWGWYQRGDEVEMWDWSDVIGDWVCRLEWIH